MTRWSIRRRHRAPQDAEREYRPGTAAPMSGRPPGAPSPAGRPGDQARAGQPGPGPLNGAWLAAGWGRPGQPGSASGGTGPYGPGEPGGAAGQRPGQPGSTRSGTGRRSASAHGPGQHGAGQHAGRPTGNGAMHPPAQPPAPAATAPLAAAPDLVPAAALSDPGPGEHGARRPGGPWPDICDQFGLQLLVLAEQLRVCIDDLEADEDDPERLKRLYQVDHAVTRMRRASRDLRTLAGRSEEELAGFTTSLLDIIRMAASAIERYTQVTIGRVTDLAVLGYAADDVSSLMAALLDNATRYSPGAVTVSSHLLGDGGVMFRIEDSGIGMGAEQVAALNAAFAGPVPEVDEGTGRRTGFPVVHRIARKHSLGVRLAARPLPGSGTVAMVKLPPHLLCEVADQAAQRRPGPAAAGSAQPPQPPQPGAVSDLPRGEPTGAQQLPSWSPGHGTDRPAERAPSDLPRREPASLHGDQPRPERREPAKVPTEEQQAAARRAFADDLTAFSLGVGGPAGPEGSPAAGEEAAGEEEDAATTATEDGARP